MPQLSVSRAATELGYRFLSYVLAVEPDMVERFVERGEPLEPQQVEALMTAVDVVAQVLEFNGVDASGRGSLGYWVEISMGQIAEGNLSLPNALRLSSGGDLPERRDDDPLRSLLLQYAREAYPYHLLAQSDDGMQTGRVGVSRIALRLPAAQEFQAKILDHPLVRNKHRAHEDLPSTRIDFPNSRGAGGVILYGLLVEITNQAWIQCQTANDTGMHRFLEEVLQAFELFIKIMSGEYVPSQVVFGISDVHLEGDPIETPWGNLLLLGAESDLAPRFGEVGTQRFAAPLVALVTSTIDEQSGQGNRYEQMQRLERPAMLLRLALGLNELSNGRQPATGRLAWWYARQPLSSGMWGDARRSGQRRAVLTLTSSEREGFLATCAFVADRHPAHLDLAAARLVGAAGDRLDPADALIDAVIAWESMFGSGQGEVSTRISVAVAVLLAKDPVSRRLLAKEVRGIYQLRSRLVHGSVSPGADALEGASRRATELGFAAMEAILQRPDLRRLTKSAERSDYLLLS